MDAKELAAIRTRWLQTCGIHDLEDSEYGCNCPNGDYRPAIQKLANEVERMGKTNSVLVAEIQRLSGETERLAAIIQRVKDLGPLPHRPNPTRITAAAVKGYAMALVDIGRAIEGDQP